MEKQTWPEPPTDTAIRKRALAIATETFGGRNVERIAATLITVARAAGRERAREELANVSHGDILEPIMDLWGETGGLVRSGVDREAADFLKAFRPTLVGILCGMRASQWEGIEAAIRLACSQHPRSRKTLEAPGSLPAPMRRGKS